VVKPTPAGFWKKRGAAGLADQMEKCCDIEPAGLSGNIEMSFERAAAGLRDSVKK
jgi:hypothetical protein